MSNPEENRPRFFSDYIGSNNGPVEYIKAVIRNNRHPKAILITGPPGCGKSTLANLYAKATQCLNRKEGEYEPCGTCDVCLGNYNDNILQVVITDASEAKETFIKLADVSRTAPHMITDREDKYRRIIIIDEVQIASTQAISVLLDPLEFCPATTTWVLISMEPDKLPEVTREAIESRCKEIRLNGFSKRDIVLGLMKGGVTHEVASTIAIFSKNNMRRAWQIWDELETVCGSNNEGGTNISVQDVLDSKGGGALHEEREIFWNSLMRNDLTRAINLCKRWSSKVDEEVLADIFLDDLLEETFEFGDHRVEFMSMLVKWSGLKPRLPLHMIISTFKMDNKDDIIIPVKQESKPKVLKYWGGTIEQLYDIYNN